jgi:hypothetical protein
LTGVDVGMLTADYPGGRRQAPVLALHGDEDRTAPVEQFRSPGLDASVAFKWTVNGNAENW